MRSKSFEVYVRLGDHNSSTIMIEKRADEKVNEWLQNNSQIRIEQFAQSL
jgi:hypothetical protein